MGSLPSPVARHVADIRLPSPLGTAVKAASDLHAQPRGTSNTPAGETPTLSARRTSPRRVSSLGRKRSYQASPLSASRPSGVLVSDRDVAGTDRPGTPSRLPQKRRNKLV